MLKAGRNTAAIQSRKDASQTRRPTVERHSHSQKRPSQHSVLSNLVQHKTFYWVTVPFGNENLALEPSVIVEEHGVPTKVVMAYLDEEIEEESAVLGLPVAFYLLTVFLLLTLSYQQAHIIRSVEEAIDFDMTENANFAFSNAMGHKNFQDVNSFADFWSWMQKGFTPLYSDVNNAVSEDSNINLGMKTFQEQRTYLWHNRKIGPVRLAQSVADVVDCPNEEAAAVYSLTCTETVGALRLDPTEYEVSMWPLDEQESATQWLMGSSEELYDLEKVRWLTNRTSRIQVSFILYNPSMDVLTQTNIQFMFARSGRIFKEITNRSLILAPFARPQTIVLAILFYLHITVLLINEMTELVPVLIRHRCNLKDSLSEYLSVWNVVDWVSFAVAYATLFTLVETNYRRNVIADKLLALAKLQDDFSDVTPYRELFSLTESFGMDSRQDRVFTAVFPVCLMLRLFKAFAAQPRLALVTNTIKVAATDLGHFGIVFGCVFITYSVMGVVCFGQEMQEFATLDRSVMSCFRMLMGDFDVAEMSEAGRTWPTTLYFSSFMALLAMIVLNMLIAIIMDAYAVVKERATNSETLPSQIMELVGRKIMAIRGKGFPLSKIKKMLTASFSGSPYDSEELLYVDSLRELLSGMTEEQARLELEGCIKDWEMAHRTHIDLNEVATLCAGIGLEMVAIGKSGDQIEESVNGLESCQAEIEATQNKHFDRIRPLDVVGGRTYHLC